MSSPTNPLLGSFVQAATTAGMDQMGANICQWITGATGGIINLSAWSNQLRTDATNAVTGITGGIDNSTLVAPTVSGLQANVATNASNIAALQAQTSSTVTGGGASVTATFNTPATGTLGPGFSLMGQSGVQFNETTSGAQIAQISGSPPQVQFAIANTAMVTDGHQASVVVGAAPGGIQETGLMVRSTATASTFVYALAQQSSIALGYGSWAGGSSTPTFNTPWTTGTVALVQGSTITLLAAGSTYTVYVNGAEVASHTDLTPQSPVGSANRYTGFIGTTGSFFGTVLGWPVASFAASDQQAVPVVGTGWNIYRTSTSTVGMSSGWQSLPSGTFDTEGPVSNGISFTGTTLGVGQVTIPKTGWYNVGFMALLNTGAGNTYAYIGAIARTPSGGSLARVFNGPTISGSGGTTAYASGPIYCNSGDVLQPMISTVSGGSILGDSLGTNTYFTGALVST